MPAYVKKCWLTVYRSQKLHVKNITRVWTHSRNNSMGRSNRGSTQQYGRLWKSKSSLCAYRSNKGRIGFHIKASQSMPWKVFPQKQNKRNEMTTNGGTKRLLGDRLTTCISSVRASPWGFFWWLLNTWRVFFVLRNPFQARLVSKENHAGCPTFDPRILHRPLFSIGVLKFSLVRASWKLFRRHVFRCLWG